MISAIRPVKPDMGEPSAVLVRTPNWLGDLMMSTAFLRALLARFPQARVDLIVRRGFETLPLPHRGRIHAFDKRAMASGAFGRQFKNGGHSHMFVLPPSLSSAWMAYRTGIPWRIGHPGQLRTFLLRPALPHRNPPRSIHLAQEYLELLEPWMRATVEAYPPGLEIDATWIARHLPAALAGAEDYAVLAPGAEFGPAKQWPPAHYREVARTLGREGVRVVVAGLPAEREAAAGILADVPGGLNLCGDTALPNLTAMLARARLLVSNDSGAMHVAAALAIPQVAIFGSTNPDWTAPLNPKAAILYRGEPCSPCYGRTCHLGHTRCLTEISPEEVLAAARPLLG